MKQRIGFMGGVLICVLVAVVLTLLGPLEDLGSATEVGDYDVRNLQGGNAFPRTHQVTSQMLQTTDGRWVGNMTGDVTAEPFVRLHYDLLGLKETDAGGFDLLRSSIDPASGLTTFMFRQFASGIEVYQSRLEIKVNREGLVVSAGGDYVPGIKLDVGTPTISTEGAALTALKDVRFGTLSDLRQVRGSESGSRDVAFESPSLKGTVKVGLVVFPTRDSGSLAWRVIIPASDAAVDLYEVVVGASDGKVLRRVRLLRN